MNYINTRFSLPEGKQDLEFVKKPNIALNLVDKCLQRGENSGVVLVDAGYGNNTTFLKQLELKKLKYIAGLAKNRKVTCQLEAGTQQVEIRLDQLAKRLNSEAFTVIQLELELPTKIWVATVKVEISVVLQKLVVVWRW